MQDYKLWINWFMNMFPSNIFKNIWIGKFFPQRTAWRNGLTAMWHLCSVLACHVCVCMSQGGKWYQLLRYDLYPFLIKRLSGALVPIITIGHALYCRPDWFLLFILCVCEWKIKSDVKHATRRLAKLFYFIPSTDLGVSPAQCHHGNCFLSTSNILKIRKRT